jgi:restriction system protein
MAKSRSLGDKLIFEALTILKEKGGKATLKEVVGEVGKRVVLDEWARGIYQKSGQIRWRSILFFYSIYCVKASFLLKKKGIWYLTPEGENALKLGKEKLLEEAIAAYNLWKEKNLSTQTKIDEITEGVRPIDEQMATTEVAKFEEIEANAIEALKKTILKKNPYEFQDLVAALLRGMGYHTPFVAPKGKDGGVDVIAYRDPLGTITPRIKAQVKHRNNAVTVQEIRQLMGVLPKDGSVVGIFISSGGFTADAVREPNHSSDHIELIDLDRFISLWQDFYDNMNDEDKSLLLLKKIYFHDPSI